MPRMPPAVTGATAHEGNLGLVFTGARVLGAWVQQGPVFPGTSRGRSHGRGLGRRRRLTSGEWVSGCGGFWELGAEDSSGHWRR